MKKLLLLAGVFLALVTTVASNNKALAHVRHRLHGADHREAFRDLA